MKLITMLIALTLVLLLTGCGPGDPFSKQQIDRCERVRIFKECLELLPAGPAQTKYNDWDEVVNACGHTAYSQSIRPVELIPNECRQR